MRDPVRVLGGAAAVALGVAACLGQEGGAPVVLSEPAVLDGSGASNPTASVAPDDDVGYVAWVSTDGGVSNVWVARIDTAGVPSGAVRVNDVPGDAAPHLQAPARVAAGAGGRVYVLWQNTTPVEGRAYPASDLRIARSNDGGRTFQPAVTVNDDAGGEPASHTFHDMLVLPDGRVVVSWLDGRPVPRPEALPASGAASHEVHGPVDGEGEGVSTVRFTVSEDGARTFGPNRVVDHEPCPCCRTALTAGADGGLYVAWRKIHPGDVRDVVVARSGDAGATWSPPRRVHEDGWVFAGCPHAGPALASDAAGDLHVAWYTGREGGTGLWYARAAPGGAFDSPTALITRDGLPPSQVALAAGRRGGVWVAWEEREPRRRTIRLASVASGTVPRPVEVSGAHPALAAGSASGVLAWLAGDSVLVSRTFASDSNDHEGGLR